jgi:hypothetical protein
MSHAQFERFAQHLRRSLPDDTITLRDGRSGAIVLSIARHKRVFVMEFRPGEGYGVDEIDDENNGWNMGYRHVFDDFNSAAGKLSKLMGIGPNRIEGIGEE